MGKTDLRRNGQSHGPGRQPAWRRQQPSTLEREGWAMDGGEGALSLKPDPSEMDDNYANDRSSSLSCSHSLFPASTPQIWYLPCGFIPSTAGPFWKEKSPCCPSQPWKVNPKGVHRTNSAFVLHSLSQVLGAHRALQVQNQSRSECSLTAGLIIVTCEIKGFWTWLSSTRFLSFK